MGLDRRYEASRGDAAEEARGYVLNNPLSFTDPSGFFFSSLFRAIGNFFKSVFRAIGNVFKATTHYVAGGALEVTTTQAGTITRKTYIAGAAVVIETEALPGQVLTDTRYLLKDHLGSLDVITDASGGVVERLSFDAWGKRRKLDWTPYMAPLG